MKGITLVFLAATGSLFPVALARPASPLLPRDEAASLTNTTTDITSAEAETNTSDTDVESGTAGKTPSAVAANWGQPQCKTQALYDLCTASNAEAYCDSVGFHNNFMASCKPPNCWCE
ncbi:uncharacterized protein CTHT_0036350 [Thermochaetoides thermophila DSM 1495]|uniref:Uncharacterized protein n=1 Tax=Chaetomium thermophilum (strain DSM 1495 / CBS 144.50 / IMI 039719) TaxID=759272 RepID=G0S7C4_CHATD|nr:hypothetical protein CTHT_0036350 [Thermochaetoides thermophila DSM 1495]EGS21768.1 hypothetical protein CTHT_0036350 [Thermochaetoides thermophila DSM 1495]